MRRRDVISLIGIALFGRARGKHKSQRRNSE